MAVIEKVQTDGQKKTGAVNGQLQFKEGDNRMVLINGSLARIIFGVLPDGSVGFIITKEGKDAFAVFS